MAKAVTQQSLGFPEGFLWGASTSAHQVEGWLQNDWTVWEHKHADRLAAQSEDTYAQWLPNWKAIKQQAATPENYRSENAVEHGKRFSSDATLLRELNLNAYRFSVEWSRIEPQEGQFDAKAIDDYARRIRLLRELNIEPIVTLWHWTLPVWLADIGGFEHVDSSKYFERFCKYVVDKLGDSVNIWLTINEPHVYASMSYVTGHWPPQVKHPLRHLSVLRNLQQSHRRAYTIIHDRNHAAVVGLAKHQIDFELGDRSLHTYLSRTVQHWWWNCWFLDGVRTSLDMIGINHYGRNRFANGKALQNNNTHRSDHGWELYPPSIYGAVKETWDRFRLPLYITEHGLADSNDHYRKWFIVESLKQLHKTIEEGADVRGYLHWSLLDNFEWDKGFWPKFGLIHVDRTTQQRTIRPSARVYAQIAKTNCVVTGKPGIRYRRPADRRHSDNES